mgnify:CR=1 FL=1
MICLPAHNPVAVAATAAIQSGNVPGLRQLLNDDPQLATVRVGDASPDGISRTLLHVATDWPGHFPEVAASIHFLVYAGADVNARCSGAHRETPLHWAASSNDVAALDALLDAGADIEASGSVLGGGPPLSDAVGFAQWDAAHRLVERGAHTTLADAATLGLQARLEAYFDGAHAAPAPGVVSRAFWGACHGGQPAAAEYLLARGANINWLPDWEAATPLDAAERRAAARLAAWLRGRGARSAADLASSSGH